MFTILYNHDGSKWVTIGRSNHFLYKENINVSGLILITAGRLKKWGIQNRFEWKSTIHQGNQFGNEIH